MQAKGYRNQNKIILANGTINSQENKMGMIAQIFFFSGNINLRNKNSTVSPLLKVTNQVDYWPFQLNWMNNTRTYKNLKTSTINSLNTSACLNVSDLFKANWEFHLSSLEYSYPSIFYIEVVFNDILFQRFRSYQDVIQWNENLSAKETNTYKDEGDQNITL
ncbi:unnamed protein product [Heterobilharzia americana]|nr:unnamed protein product [Heterobilharzia americana]